MIRPREGGWNLGIPQVCLSCVSLPGTHVHTEVSRRKLKEQGGRLATLWRGVPGLGVHLLSLPFLGPCSWFLLGNFKSGQLELGGHVLSLFCPLNLCSPCKISPSPLGVNEVHFPAFGSLLRQGFRDLNPGCRRNQQYL